MLPPEGGVGAGVPSGRLRRREDPTRAPPGRRRVCACPSRSAGRPHGRVTRAGDPPPPAGCGGQGHGSTCAAGLTACLLQVSALFKDGTIGGNINIVIVGLILLEEEQVIGLRNTQLLFPRKIQAKSGFSLSLSLCLSV